MKLRTHSRIWKKRLPAMGFSFVADWAQRVISIMNRKRRSDVDRADGSIRALAASAGIAWLPFCIRASAARATKERSA
jgi:hypothetical protein